MSSSISSNSVRNALQQQKKCKTSEHVSRKTHGREDNPRENGFRRKLKGFLKKAHITTVLKKVVEGSKSFIIGLASRLAPKREQPSHESAESDTNPAVPSRERVYFPDYYPPSPMSSSGTASSAASSPLPSHHLPSSNIPLPISAPISAPAPYPTSNDATTNHSGARHETENERSSSNFRYKEKDYGKLRHFPEIEIGVVRARVLWLQPRMSGEKSGERVIAEDPTLRKAEILDVPTKVGMENAQALETHQTGGLALNGEGDAKKVPSFSESDDESVLDESPRRFKHRLPEEEPKPWVEPGTVEKGAMWLRPILSGKTRTNSGYSGQETPTSPTRVSQNVFQ